MKTIEEIVSSISNPKKIWSRSEVLSRPNPIPTKNGIYAWYFSSIPPQVPVEACNFFEDKTLLYVGISPKNESSSQDLRKRVTTHFRGNAEGSTLRLSLGVLLSKISGFDLRRVGSGKRKTFTHLGEQWLDSWMEENAHVLWVEHEMPWNVEKEILSKFSLPLNIQDNEHHHFSKRLSCLRVKAKKEADELPIANEDSQKRSS
jgi:hypothetical protein